MFKLLVILCLMSLVYTQDEETTSVEPDTTEVTDTTEETDTTEGTTKPTDPTTTNGPMTTCPPYDAGDPTYIPDDTYCGIFYECSSGKAIEFNCAPGTYFSIEHNECEFGVDCGDRLLSTTTGTTTEEY